MFQYYLDRRYRGFRPNVYLLIVLSENHRSFLYGLDINQETSPVIVLLDLEKIKGTY